MNRLLSLCFCLIASIGTQTPIKLPQIIHDSMILQRNTKINIWGWASKGEKVSVQFSNKSYKTIPSDKQSNMILSIKNKQAI